MKKLVLLTVFYFAAIPIGFSQKSDSSKTPKIKLSGIFISAGINVTQYNSDAFFDSLSSSIGAYNSARIFRENFSSGDTIPSHINHNKLLTSTSARLGIIINSGSYKNIYFNHLFEASYNTGISSSYSYSVEYEELNYFGFGGAGADIIDTFQFSYKQSILSIGYKFQPTYKFMFLSFGVHCSFNFVKVTENKKEQIHFAGYNEVTGSYSYTTNSVSDTSIRMDFINVPLEFGIGGVIHMNRISLEPAFYFTPRINYGYNFYNLSLEILFNPSKRS